MSSHPFDLPPSFDSQVRLFPLPDHVVFPGNVFPLRIFESRYKEMLDDAIKCDRLITMATLRPGFEHESYSRPPIEPFVCIGRIVVHKATDQGTHNLMLLGLQRAKIEYEIEPVRSFRRAKVSVIANVDSEASDADEVLAKQLADRVVHTWPTAQALIDKFIGGELSLALMTDIVAFHLPLAIRVKLELLAHADSVARAELLMEHLPPAASSNQRRHWYFQDFSDN